jgi:hypothetical protein
MIVHQRCVTAATGLIAAAILAVPSLAIASKTHSPSTATRHSQPHHPAAKPKSPTHPAKGNGSGTQAGIPVEAMETALQIKGSFSNGVFSASFDRPELSNVTDKGIPIKPSFELNGEMDFQSLGHGEAFLNGDLPVKPEEINGVIDAILNNGLTFQAEHQHFYDFEPMVWFIHLRGKGDALRLASAVHSVLQAGAIPLPQEPPAHPTTPLNKHKLQSILHGYEAVVGEDGVVTVYVAPPTVHIDGVRVKPETNIATNISFEPLNAEGTETAAAPDFGMEAQDVNPLMSVMRAQGWDIGCLYNQETDEHPQLFFSHQLKTGNPYKLAEEIRNGLNEISSHK